MTYYDDGFGWYLDGETIIKILVIEAFVIGWIYFNPLGW